MEGERNFTAGDAERYLHEESNWGRWGPDDELGAINLITDEKRRQAASLVRTGQSISLSRPFPVQPGPVNPRPALHMMERFDMGSGAGASGDFYGLHYHGADCTHIDALCHVWDHAGMYNGRQANDVIGFHGTSFGGIEHWRHGIVTRGVLLDVPGFRGVEYVSQDKPVHGWELEAICRERNIAVEPGDALVVYSGREQFAVAAGRPWGSGPRSHPDQMAPDRPGLHASCLQFIRESDCSMILWDMMDMIPNGIGLPWSVHGAIFAYGVALVDNARLDDLVDSCRAQDRNDFMVVAAPLPVYGGTGSPLNPLAVL